MTLQTNSVSLWNLRMATKEKVPGKGESSSSPPVEKPRSNPCKKFCKTLYRIISSHVGLIVILLAYSFIGAALFQVSKLWNLLW